MYCIAFFLSYRVIVGCFSVQQKSKLETHDNSLINLKGCSSTTCNFGFNIVNVLFIILKDAIELGVVFIGSENHGYSVRECVPKGTRGNKWKCGVIVETPDRQFVFMCEQERDQREWVEALKTVISKPMMPQDYTSKMYHSLLVVLIKYK